MVLIEVFIPSIQQHVMFRVSRSMLGANLKQAICQILQKRYVLFYESQDTRLYLQRTKTVIAMQKSVEDMGISEGEQLIYL